MQHSDFLKESFDMDFLVQSKHTNNWNMKDYHFHDIYEVFFSQTDGVKFFVEDKVFNVQKNDLFIFNHLDLHRTFAPEETPYDRYLLLFKPSYIQDFSSPTTDLLDCFLNRSEGFSHCIHLSDTQSLRMLSLFKRALNYFHSDCFGKDIYQKITLIEILLFINELYSVPYEYKPVKSERNYNRIDPILKYINANLASELSLAHLSNKFFLSKYHLGVIFKQATGFTVNEYVLTRRILMAQALLKKDILVSEVSEIVGFNSTSHFIRTFSKMVGISPKQYAK